MSISGRALVINVTPYRESDLIVQLLTEQSGRVGAIARSARSSKRRFMGGLNVFDCAFCELAPGKGSSHLLSLNVFSNREVWSTLRTNMTAFLGGCFCIEVVSQFVLEGEEEGREYFPILYKSLRALDQLDDEVKMCSVAIYCGLKVLKIAGFDVVESSGARNHELGIWFEAMSFRDRPLPPQDTALLVPAVSLLFETIEEAVGKRLRTRTDFLPRVLRVTQEVVKEAVSA